MNDGITLRPAREDDVPRLGDLTQDPEKAGEFEWTGWSDLQRWRRGWAGNGLIGPDGGTLIVTRSGEWLGLVNWRRHDINGPAVHSWEIGIMLLPEARGHGRARRPRRRPSAPW